MKDFLAFKVWNEVKTEKKKIFANFVLSLTSNILQAALPAFLYYFYHEALAKNAPLDLFLALGILLAVFAGMFSYLGIRYSAYQLYMITAMLKEKLFNHLLFLSPQYYKTAEKGDIAFRTFQDVEIFVNQLINKSVEAIDTLVFVFLCLLFLAVISPLASFLMLIVVFVVLLISYRFSSKPMMLVTKKSREKGGMVWSSFLESLSNIELVQAFNLQSHRFEKFKHILKQEVSEKVKAEVIISFLWTVMNFIFQASIILGIYFSVTLGGVFVAKLMAIILYAIYLLPKLMNLASYLTGIHIGHISFERYLDIINKEPEVKMLSDAVPLREVSGKITFDNVSFCYENKKKILDQIKFDVEPGETVTIAGPNGAGKTTLIHLIPRLIDPTEGRIEIDNQDIRKFTLESLRRYIGFVSQNIKALTGTVIENIILSRKDKSLEDVRKIAKEYSVDEIFTSLPDGYNTPIGEGGTILSGGQLQILAIIRAVLLEPKILILDEATAHLDPFTEMAINRAIAAASRGRTTLVVAHRQSTVISSRRILVLKDGKIVEEGSHYALVKKRGFYYTFFSKNLTSEQESRLLFVDCFAENGQVTVTLKMRRKNYMGSAPILGDPIPAAINATLEVIKLYSAEGLTFFFKDARELHVNGKRVLLVAVSTKIGETVQDYFGVANIEHEESMISAVRATLNAVNREIELWQLSFDQRLSEITGGIA